MNCLTNPWFQALHDIVGNLAPHTSLCFDFIILLLQFLFGFPELVVIN